MMSTAATAGITPANRLLRPRGLAALLAVSLVLNLCFIGGALWTRSHAPPVLTASERFHRLGQSLDLSPPQQHAFDQYVSGMLARGEHLRQASEPLMTDAWAEIAKPDPDEAKVLQLLDESTALRRDFQHDAVAATVSLLATFTPEQRAKFLADERERRAEMRRRRAEEMR
jgi:Spy/CpxP family protein refolding chaperone